MSQPKEPQVKTSKEQQLWLAATEGNLEDVMKLAKDPAVDVNWGDEELGRTSTTGPAATGGHCS